MRNVIASARLIAPASRRQAFYTIWIEPAGPSFRVVKESGAGGRVLHRQAWDFTALPDAEKLFRRRIRAKTNPLTKRERLYQLIIT